MHWHGWLVVILAVTQGGWLAFDGAHALIVGDYITPKSGSHAGQLGPWSKLVSAIGIDPRSTFMKSFHFVLGTTWILMIVFFVLGLPWAPYTMLACAVAGLWYVPFGTLLSVVQILVLLLR